MTELSSDAQTVLNVVLPVYDDEHLYVATAEKHAGMIAAAALRAVANRVVPETTHPDAEEWLGQPTWVQVESRVRFKLLAIANELEAQ